MMAALMALPGVATANGDALKGQTYADASAQVAKYDSTAQIVVSTVVGSVLQRDECIVSSSTRATHSDGTGKKKPATYYVNLNCNGALASSNTPGPSSASPEGMSEQKIRDTVDLLNASPEWCTKSAKNHDLCVQFCKSGKCTFEVS
jgi:hypothetical protein